MTIPFSTSFTDLGRLFSALANLNGMCGAQPPLGAYKITCTSASATVGATYTNNGVTFTVLATISSGTTLFISGNGAPAASGTLTKSSGTGDSTITYSAFVSYSEWGTLGPVIKCQTTMVSDILTRLEGAGLTALIPYGSWQTTISSMDSQLQSQKQAVQSLAQQVLITRVNNDVPQQDPTSLSQAMAEWIRQMQSGSPTTVKACVVSAATTPGVNNIGNATVYASLLDTNGLTLEYSFHETMVLRCIEDQNTGATAGSETLSITSPAQVGETLSYLWPGGSGLQTNVVVCDPTQGYGSGQNLIGGGSTTTGAFKAWTGIIPNGWTIETDGTNISDGTTNNYAGTAHCLAIAGNTLGTNAHTALYQTFANGGISSGSTQSLEPNTVYQFYCQVKADVVPAAGALQINLVDGSNTIVANNQGTNNTISVNLTALGGTDYVTVTGTFQTPTNMPTNIRLQIIASTQITSASNIFIDFACLTQPSVQGNNYGGLYAGGPYLSVFRGSVDLVNYVSETIGDSYGVAISNDYGSTSPTPLGFQVMFLQIFDMASLGYILPSSGSPSISNSLIS